MFLTYLLWLSWENPFVFCIRRALHLCISVGTCVASYNSMGLLNELGNLHVAVGAVPRLRSSYQPQNKNLSMRKSVAAPTITDTYRPLYIIILLFFIFIIISIKYVAVPDGAVCGAALFRSRIPAAAERSVRPPHPWSVHLKRSCLGAGTFIQCHAIPCARYLCLEQIVIPVQQPKQF